MIFVPIVAVIRLEKMGQLIMSKPKMSVKTVVVCLGARSEASETSAGVDRGDFNQLQTTVGSTRVKPEKSPHPRASAFSRSKGIPIRVIKQSS